MSWKLPRAPLLAGLAVLLLALGLVIVTFFQNLEPGAVEPSSPSATRSSSRPIRPDSAPKQSLSRLIRNPPSPEYSSALLEDHLVHRKRNAESLLAAFRITSDPEYLREALEKFPDRPEVLLAAIENTRDPSEQLDLLETLKHNDPENGLANLLSAKALLELGRTGEALAELSAASGKDIRDFCLENIQYTEEAWLVQLPPAEAKWAAFRDSTATSLMSLSSMARQMSDLAKELALAGDSDTAGQLRDFQKHLGEQLQKPGSSVVHHLVGLSVEKLSLAGLDTKQTADLFAAIDERRSLIRGDALAARQLLENQSIPDESILIYMDRAKNLGEIQANRWLLEQYGEP